MGTKTAYCDAGPCSHGGASRRSHSQQLDESIDIIIAGPNTVIFSHPNLQLHPNALQQAPHRTNAPLSNENVCNTGADLRTKNQNSP